MWAAMQERYLPTQEWEAAMQKKYCTDIRMERLHVGCYAIDNTSMMWAAIQGSICSVSLL